MTALAATPILIPGPAPRREGRAFSARSLLLTMLGEFALTTAEPVWTAAVIESLRLVGIEEKAARQALARSAAEGLLIVERLDGGAVGPSRHAASSC